MPTRLNLFSPVLLCMHCSAYNSGQVRNWLHWKSNKSIRNLSFQQLFTNEVSPFLLLVGENQLILGKANVGTPNDLTEGAEVVDIVIWRIRGRC